MDRKEEIELIAEAFAAWAVVHQIDHLDSFCSQDTDLEGMIAQIEAMYRGLA